MQDTGCTMQDRNDQILITWHPEPAIRTHAQFPHSNLNRALVLTPSKGRGFGQGSSPFRHFVFGGRCSALGADPVPGARHL